MITLENRFFPLRRAICFLVEGGIIFVSVLVSFAVLQRANDTGVVNFGDALVRGAVVAFFCQICMYMLDLYDLRQSQTRGELFFSLIFAIGFVCIGIGVISYAIPSFGVEGQMYYLTIFFVAVFLLFWRIFFEYYINQAWMRENILIIGTGEEARLTAEEVRKRERLGFQLTGFIAASSRQNDVRVKEIGDILGQYGNMKEIVRKLGIRKVVVAIGERRGEYPVKEMLDLRVSGCQIVEWPGFFEKLSGRIPIDSLSPSFFIFNQGFRKSKILLFTRRILSLMVAIILQVILLPVFLIVAIAIKLDSPGPVLYSQDRVGQNGKVFRIFKFRSMVQDAEKENGATWAVKNDHRITRVGRFIRRTRIDELPQLFNVLRGDLNIFGPRPERPEYVEKLEKLIPYYSLRHTVKPGLTGWAQVMYSYSGTIEESKEKCQYDLFYIKNMSIKLDLMILFHTVKIVLLERGAR